jgi:HPt (histidine-containing phosphotransfer) domain-containing protein
MNGQFASRFGSESLTSVWQAAGSADFRPLVPARVEGAQSSKSTWARAAARRNARALGERGASPRAVPTAEGTVSPAIGREDAVRYIELLDRRLFRLRTALTTQNAALALVMLRSLGSVSESVGAEELTALAASMEGHVSAGDFAPLRGALSDLVTLVAAAKAALTARAAA